MAIRTGATISGIRTAINALGSLSGRTLERHVDEELRIVAQAAAERMKERMASAPPPRKITLAIRKALGFKGSAPFVRSGKLVKSITARRLRRGVWFAGIPAGIRVSGSRFRLDQIARLQEQGEDVSVRVTKEFQNFILFLGHSGVFGDDEQESLRIAFGLIKGKAAIGKTFVIIIPARPTIIPTAKEIAPKVVPGIVNGLSVRLTGLGAPRVSL